MRRAVSRVAHSSCRISPRSQNQLSTKAHHGSTTSIVHCGNLAIVPAAGDVVAATDPAPRAQRLHRWTSNATGGRGRGSRPPIGQKPRTLGTSWDTRLTDPAGTANLNPLTTMPKGAAPCTWSCAGVLNANLLRSLCPIVANGRRWEESDLAHYWWKHLLRRAPSMIALKITTSHGLQATR